MVIITENGCETSPQEETLKDYARIHFYRGYLTAVAQGKDKG